MLSSDSLESGGPTGALAEEGVGALATEGGFFNLLFLRRVGWVWDIFRIRSKSTLKLHIASTDSAQKLRIIAVIVIAVGLLLSHISQSSNLF